MGGCESFRALKSTEGKVSVLSSGVSFLVALVCGGVLCWKTAACDGGGGSGWW